MHSGVNQLLLLSNIYITLIVSAMEMFTREILTHIIDGCLICSVPTCAYILRTPCYI